MYDPMSEAQEFIGQDRAEALAKATTFFGVPASELAVREVDTTLASGLGTRIAVVAYLRSAGPPAGGGGDRDREPRRGREDREPRGDRGSREARGDGRARGGDRDRGGRSERGGRDRGGRGERSRERSEDGARAATARPEPPAAQSSTGTARTPLGEIGQFVCGLVERMGVGTFEISESDATEGTIALQLSGAAAARLAGGDGRTIEAVQLLANQASLRAGGDDAKRVIVEVEGNEDERTAFLEKIADRAAQRATETGRPVALEAMSPKDRRVIHVALRDSDAVATMTVGEGRYRQVVVVPQNAPEYEEAKRYETQSQRENRD
jgi:spoIIIJ-associated protein